MWPFDRLLRRDEPLGRQGERLAARFLKRRGLKLLARNYRCPSGEIDLIMLDRSTACGGGAQSIVFVEVKTRSSDKHVSPRSAVNAEKQRRLRKAASYYRSQRDTSDYRYRFDVVSIVIDPTGAGAPRIEHIPQAF